MKKQILTLYQEHPGKILVDKTTHHIPYLQYKLLEYLAENTDRILPTSAIYDFMWEQNEDDDGQTIVEEAQIYYHISRLRSRGLKITNFAKFGYRLEAEVKYI